MIQMPTTYLCESGFSCLCEITSCKRNSFTPIDPLMRGQLKRISFLGLECWLIKCNSKKVIKHNFLNLWCASSCVILSANCGPIVFLHINFSEAFCLISSFKHMVQELVTRFFRVQHKRKVEEHWTR